MQGPVETMNSIVKWVPLRKEWEPDPHKPFLVQILKKAVFAKMVDLEFLAYFKNSLSLMCEAWLKRKGIDPTINTSKNYHMLQDEFFKVLAHVNRGFEMAVHADWRSGVGTLMGLWHDIKRKGDAQWIDHRSLRQKNNPVSRFELREEPRQDVADAFWVSLFRNGIRRKRDMMAVAEKIDDQQSRFFVTSLHLDEHMTFTETKINMVTHTQEVWIGESLSSKLGLQRGFDFLEETFAASVSTMMKAGNIIAEGQASLWLIRNFFRLHRREWGYLFETLTGGHVALERLFGSVIATLALGHDRKTFELGEGDAGELFRMFWEGGLSLPVGKAEPLLDALHQSIMNREEYKIFTKAASVMSALTVSDGTGKRLKRYGEAQLVLKSLGTLVEDIVAYHLDDVEVDVKSLTGTIESEGSYALFIKKVQLLLKLDVEIHRVVENIFWNVIDTFSDLLTAHTIQKKKIISKKQSQELKRIAAKYHLRLEEDNYLMYAPNRCYIGKEISDYRKPAQR